MYGCTAGRMPLEWVSSGIWIPLQNLSTNLPFESKQDSDRNDDNEVRIGKAVVSKVRQHIYQLFLIFTNCQAY